MVPLSLTEESLAQEKSSRYLECPFLGQFMRWSRKQFEREEFERGEETLSHHLIFLEFTKYSCELGSQTEEEESGSFTITRFSSLSQQRIPTIFPLSPETFTFTYSIFPGFQPLSPKLTEVVKPRSIKETLEFFKDRISEIQEVQQVSAYISNDFINIYTIFNSPSDTEEEVYESIYQVEQNTLEASDWESIDFHTINLADFPQEQWPQLIPKDAQIIFKRE